MDFLPIPMTHKLVINREEGPIEWGAFSSYYEAKKYAKSNRIHHYRISEL